MALPFDINSRAHDSRTLTILAKTIYRELRAEGYGTSQVMTLAGELLGLVAGEVKDRRAPISEPAPRIDRVEASRVEGSIEVRP
jgi:hypothetical protein